MIDLPHNHETERAAIACIVARPAILDAETVISAESFHSPAASVVFAAMRRMRDTFRPIDPVTVAAEIMATTGLESIGGAEYLGNLSAPDIDAAHWPEYAAHLHDLRLRRAAIISLESLSGAVSRAPNYEAFGPKLEMELSKLVALAHGARPEPTMRETVMDVVEELERRQTGNSDTYQSSGIRALDIALGGLAGGKSYVIAAPPSEGKSALAMTLALNLAQRTIPVGIFSLEMPREEIVERWFAAKARINGIRMRDGEMSAGELSRIAEESLPMSRLPVRIDDSPDQTIERIRGKARAWKANGGLGLIVTDYIQLVQTIPGESRELGISLISKGHKQMAKELDAPVLLLSQLNDDGKLRESRAIGQDADVVLMIEDDGVRVHKQRGGRRGQLIPLRFVPEFCRWTDAD